MPPIQLRASLQRSHQLHHLGFQLRNALLRQHPHAGRSPELDQFAMEREQALMSDGGLFACRERRVVW